MTAEITTQTVEKEKAGPAIHLTEKAAKKIIALLEKDGVSPQVGGLRVGVQGGGCSGLSYAMRLDTQARDRDKIFEEFGARLFVDPKSLLYLNGTSPGVRRDADAPGLCVSEPQRGAQLRLRQQLYGVRSRTGFSLSAGLTQHRGPT